MRNLALVQMIILILTMVTLVSCASPSLSKKPYALRYDAVQLALQERLTSDRRHYSLTILGEVLRYPELVQKFYQRRHFQPAWSHKRKPNRASWKLVHFIRNAEQEGLNPRNFHLAAIEAARNVVDMELLLTDAYFLLNIHLAGIQENPHKNRFVWRRVKENHRNLILLLEEGLATRKFDKHLEKIVPKESGYQRLKQALARYRIVANQGGWPWIPEGPPLHIGDQGKRVKLLHERLQATSDIKNPSLVFDEKTDAAVRNFQRRHGLVVDGLVGGATLRALNVSVHERIDQLKINLQRRRWLPDPIGNRYIVVNIPDFRLTFMEQDRPILGMNVIVGQAERTWQTPLVMSSITHMILNPQWNVPPNIFKKELIEKIRKNPDYLSKHNMKVVKAKKVIDPGTIDWSTIKGNEGIRIVQRSGHGNALGKMKFMFPNPYDIYMHDTPSKSLFNRHRRTFSHGCIRVAEPLDLAEEIFKNSKWSRKKITSEIASEERQTIILPEPVNVYVQYWTAWVEADGDVNFRNDVYKRDGTIRKIIGI